MRQRTTSRQQTASVSVAQCHTGILPSAAGVATREQGRRGRARASSGPVPIVLDPNRQEINQLVAGYGRDKIRLRYFGILLPDIRPIGHSSLLYVTYRMIWGASFPFLGVKDFAFLTRQSGNAIKPATTVPPHDRIA